MTATNDITESKLPSTNEQLQEDEAATAATSTGDEPPVWVMRFRFIALTSVHIYVLFRDSYLKRLQREESRALEIERRRLQEEHDAAIATAAVSDGNISIQM